MTPHTGGGRSSSTATSVPATAGPESGSPDGQLIGMVFAASTRTDSVAYAVSASELQPFLDQQPATTEPVDVGACR